jgi:hypothetical protein
VVSVPVVVHFFVLREQLVEGLEAGTSWLRRKTRTERCWCGWAGDGRALHTRRARRFPSQLDTAHGSVFPGHTATDAPALDEQALRTNRDAHREGA